jgi:protein-histidine pros-kinase
MKSLLFKTQLKEVLGVRGLGEWTVRMDALRTAGQPDLAEGMQRLLASVDSTYVRFAALQQTLAELAGGVMSDWNLDNGTIDSGPDWKKPLGYGPEEGENTVACWEGLVHPDDIAQIRQRIAAHVEGHAPLFEAEYRARTKTGDWRWMMIRGRVVSRSAHAETTRALVFHKDISATRDSEATLRAAKEAAEAANRARGAFLANMSHEIRTPMNAVLGMIELALDTRLDAEQRGYLETVRSSAQALLTIIDDVLNFSKIEAGRMQFEEIEVPLHVLVAETARSLAYNAHQKGIELIFDIESGVPERVRGDPTRLRQVLTNLVGNAIKFTDAGQIAIGVALDRVEEDSVYLRFSVADSGIGIPVEKQRTIFEAFSQADVSTTRRYGGTGLGLAICSRLVQMMDGQISIESAPGQGSVFRFTARFGAGECSHATPRTLPMAERGGRALIIDENEAVGRQLAAMLRELGLQATCTRDGTTAAAAIASSQEAGQPYRLVFASSAMAAPVGFSLLDHSGLLQRERVVMMLTTHNQRQDLDRCNRCGVRARLVKPIGREDLMEAIELALGIKSETRLAEFRLEEAVSAGGDAGMDVLLVEDNPVNQTLAVKLLEKGGNRVTVANNGREALDALESKRFDVIFMDVQMPVMGGIEATEAIRAREMRRSWVMSTGFRPAYIVAMTAHAMDGDRERCLQAGMDDYLSKPIQLKALHEALDRARAARSCPDRFTENAYGMIAGG